MSDSSFEVTWEADDGYCGGAPHSFDIRADDIDPNDSEAAIRALFWELVEEQFREHVHAISGDEEAFVDWAKSVQEEANV